MGANGNDAPLPWLSGTVEAQGKQAWSASGDMLVVQYPFVRRDYYRQMISQYKRLWWLLAFLGAIVVSALFVMYRYGSSSGKASPIFYIPLAIVTLEIPVLTWVIAIAMEKTMRGRLHQVTLSAAGVNKRIEPAKWGEIQLVTQWAKVSRVRESQGDTLVFPRFGLHAVTVPITAFADADAARRFHDAAVVLWQTSGNMNAVAESVRAEFATQPDAPASV